MLETTSANPAPAMPLPEIYARVERHIPAFEWPILADDIAAILKLKRERNAVVLAHNYQTPEIFHTVADIVGDSLALAREAARTDADVIVLAGVHFMAETAKLLNPEKTVLIPDLRAGCSLAASITAADIRLMRERHPGVPIVTYVNTSADVKAESDICCTSSNAVQVVESFGADKVIVLPDVEMVRPCNLCPHMKRITLPKILDSLVYLREEVTVDPMIADKARRSVERMINLKN